MHCYSFVCTIVLFASFANHALTAASGLIELDEFNFDKVTNKFEASFIKFDILYPFGNKHEAFKTFAKDTTNYKDLLIAQVLVKDYGDKTNVALAGRHGATKEKLPVVKLFVKGKSKAIPFDEDAEGFTSDKLRRFVSENCCIQISLPGCVKEFDKLVIQFMKAKKNKRKKVLKKTEELLKSFDKELSSGKIYKTIMEKILEKGDNFIQSEVERVKKLLSGKVSDQKKKQLQTHNNILKTFQNLTNKQWLLQTTCDW